MNKALLCAALAGIVTAGATVSAQAADESKEKCYGIAKAGKNDCKSADGKHSCAGHAAEDNNKNEWKYVAKGECEKMEGGSLTSAVDAAKAKK